MPKNRGVSALSQARAKLIDYVREQNPELANQLQVLKAPSWYRIKNSVDSDEADLYIYDEIVPQFIAEWLGGISAQGLIDELNEITASTINVRINSPGGAVFEAVAIYNALMSHSATINVFVDSLAASAASVIAMAGDTVTMMIGSQMMIHDASIVEIGNAAVLRETADWLDDQSDNIASIYAEKAGGDPQTFRDLMLKETWLFAEEAVELGLADSVYKRTENAPPDESEEEDPDTEEEETESEGDEDEDMPHEDEELEDLMNRRHRLVARGFKYAGRRRAPNPLENEVDAILAALKG